MKIGVDATPLRMLSGGIGFYVFYLLEELIVLAPHDQFFLYSLGGGDSLSYFKKYSNVTIREISFLGSCHSLWGQTTLAWYCYRDRLDCFWGTTQSIPLLARRKMKTVFVLYDFVYRLHPQTVATVKCLYQKLCTQWMLREADRIMTISHATATKLQQYYGLCAQAVVQPPRKREIYMRSREKVEAFLREKNLEYKSYLLTIATLEPRKNLSGLVDAYMRARSQAEGEVIPLVIVGGGGWKNAQLLYDLTQAEKTYPGHIILAGRASDLDLAHYLTGARYYITLSLYEGYGMPLQEARLCGTPVIALDQPEMREAAENEGIFLSQEEVSRTLTRVISKQNKNEERVSSCAYPSNASKAQDVYRLLS